MVFLCAVFYIIQVFGKMYSSWTTIDSIREFDTSQAEAAAQRLSVWFDDSFFPYQSGSLDINTICWVSAFMAVIRGYTRQSVSSFRMPAVLAFSFILTALPGLIGGLQYLLPVVAIYLPLMINVVLDSMKIMNFQILINARIIL